MWRIRSWRCVQVGVRRSREEVGRWERVLRRSCGGGLVSERMRWEGEGVYKGKAGGRERGRRWRTYFVWEGEEGDEGGGGELGGHCEICRLKLELKVQLRWE